MIVHSLKQIFRSLWKYKSFSIINLLGLSIGIAAVLLIFMIGDYENSFDRFHTNGDKIFRVVSHAKKGGKDQYEATVPNPTGKFLRTEFSGLKATQIYYIGDANIRIGHQSPFEEKNIMFADSLFFSVFDFGAIKGFALRGDAVQALATPGKAILTESTAKRYFGITNPVGQIFKIDAKLEVEVAAIIKDPPPTTHFPFKMLISYSSLTKDFAGGLDLNSWGLRSNGYCYVRTDGESSVPSVERALYSINQKNSDSERNKRERFYLQPLAQIHFDAAFESTNPGYTISARYLTMLFLLGGFIILIACINYINLSTSLAFTKSKEVGIRKTIGASRTQLFFHYMSETVVLTFIAAMAGILLAITFLPVVNQLLEKSVATG